MEVGQVVSNDDVIGAQCFNEVNLGGSGGDGGHSANTVTSSYDAIAAKSATCTH